MPHVLDERRLQCGCIKPSFDGVGWNEDAVPLFLFRRKGDDAVRKANTSFRTKFPKLLILTTQLACGHSRFAKTFLEGSWVLQPLLHRALVWKIGCLCTLDGLSWPPDEWVRWPVRTVPVKFAHTHTFFFQRGARNTATAAISSLMKS